MAGGNERDGLSNIHFGAGMVNVIVAVFVAFTL